MTSSSFPFHAGDYHALFIWEAALALRAQGLQVLVITPAASPGQVGLETREGIIIQRFSYPGLGTGFLRLTGRDGMVQNLRRNPLCLVSVPALLLAFFAVLRQVRLQFNPDYVVSHWLVPTGLVTAMARFTAPTLHFGHSSDVHLLARLPGKKFVAALLERRGKLVATSPFLHKKMLHFSKGPIAVVPLGVRIGPGPRTGFDARKPRFCFMGRLVPGKGLYRAVSILSKRPNWSLTIAGDGAEKDQLPRPNPITDGSLRFAGPVIGEAKQALLRSHDFLLFLPDLKDEDCFQDNVPVSILEALGQGLPVVATASLGLKSLFQEDEILFVDPDPTAIRAAIEAIDVQQYAQLSARAYSTGQRFCRTSSAAKTLDLLRT